MWNVELCNILAIDTPWFLILYSYYWEKDSSILLKQLKCYNHVRIDKCSHTFNTYYVLSHHNDVISDYIVGKHHQLATNSIEILMIHLKKIGGRKLAHINFCGGSFRPPLVMWPWQLVCQNPLIRFTGHWCRLALSYMWIFIVDNI